MRAGHNPLLHVSNHNSKPVYIQPPGLAIGLDSGEKFNQIIKLETVKLSSGDNLLLFTDGVTEARNNSGEEYGEERLSKIIDKSKKLGVFEIKENILDDIMNFVGNYPLHDDLTFIVIKRN